MVLCSVFCCVISLIYNTSASLLPTHSDWRPTLLLRLETTATERFAIVRTREAETRAREQIHFWKIAIEDFLENRNCMMIDHERCTRMPMVMMHRFAR